MREKIEKVLNGKIGIGIDKFCNTGFYAAAIGAVCIICHTFNIPIVGAFLLAVLLVPALVFCKNSFVLAPFFMMCSFVISKETMPQSGYYNTPGRISALCIALVIMLSALVFNLVYYGKWRLIFKRAYLTVSMCIMSGALVVGGLFSGTFSVGGIGMSLAIAATTFLPYTLMVNCGQYEGRKTIEYFAWALIVSSVVIGAAVLKQYVLYDFDISSANKGSTLTFGHSISNTAAAIVVLAIPMTFYLVYRYKYGFLYLLLVAMELAIILFTYSRASLITAVPGTLIVAIVLCFKKKTGRLGYYIMCGLALVAAIVFCIVFWDKISGKLSGIMSGGVNDSGRFELWKYGFDAWKEKPIFGVGLWYLVINKYGSTNYYSFHCTPLTYLYCAGIVGLIAYLYHRYKTVRLVFSGRLGSERVFTALAILAMIVNALLDIAMTLPPNLLYYSMLLALVECDVKFAKSKETVDNANTVNCDGESSVNTISEGEI